MSKVCESCERGGKVINWRSHSNIATKHKQQVNLQSRKIDGLRMRVCTSCIRSIKYKKETAAAVKA